MRKGVLMSTYLTSDPHGDLRSFKKLLNKIKFDPGTDIMYILGDVLDRGTENLALLCYVREYIDRGSMFLIKGNHELFAEMYLDGRLDAEQWIAWGGKNTLKDIEALGSEEKKELKVFISGLCHYKVLQGKEKTILLTHSGLDADHIVETESGLDVIASIDKALETDEFQYLISNDIHYMPAGQIKKMDIYTIVGHVPVMRLNEDGSCKIVQKKHYMCIDTGAAYREAGGRMSCYCLEDGTEIYV